MTHRKHYHTYCSRHRRLPRHARGAAFPGRSALSRRERAWAGLTLLWVRLWAGADTRDALGLT
jgi:hypothetical protein